MTDLTLSGLLTSFVDSHGPGVFREPGVASNLLSDVLGDSPDLDPVWRQALVASVRDRTLARLLDRGPLTVDGWAADRARTRKPDWLYEAWAAPCDREVFPVEVLTDGGFGVYAVDLCRRFGFQPVRPMPTQRPIEAMLALAADGAVMRVAGIKLSPLDGGGNGGGVTPTPVHATAPRAPYAAIVSQAASGETLGDRVASLGPASATAGSSVMRTLSAAVADLHRQGITHGLIGTENILFDTWQTVVLTDAGLAGLAGRTATVDNDLQALATVAFYVFSGAAPPAGTHRNSVAKLIDVAPHAPTALAALVDRTLSPDAQGVRPTALDYYRSLDLTPPPPPPISDPRPTTDAAPDATTASPPTSEPVPVPAAVARPEPRVGRKALAGALAGILVIGAGVAFAVKSRSNDDSATSPSTVTTVVTVATPANSTSPSAATSSIAVAATATSGSTPVSTIGVAPAAELTAVDGMVPVEAGIYPVGSAKGGVKSPTRAEDQVLDGSLSRPVELKKFFIDVTEVSNEEYFRWLQTGPPGVPTPNYWGDDGALDAGTEKRPVQGVAIEHADAFCRALGKRLPHEDEWEVAAASTQPFTSPTNDDTTYDVGIQPANVSSVGAFDMVGNAWEYVTDSYEQSIRDDPNMVVIRGGTNNFLVDPSKREGGSPTAYYMAKWVGFRCAVGAEDPSPTLDFRPVEIKVPPPVAPQPNIAVDELDYDFKDPTTNTWPGRKTEDQVSGYHPLDSFHLEVSGDSADLVSLAPSLNLDYDRNNYSITAIGSIFVNKTESDDGYCFGVGAGIDGNEQGIFLNVCPTDPAGLATANIFVRASDGSKCPLFVNQTQNIKRDQRVTLQINVLGADSFQFLVDNRQVNSGTVDGQIAQCLGIAGGRGVGLYLQSAPGQSKVHVHFSRFAVSKTPKA